MEVAATSTVGYVSEYPTIVDGALSDSTTEKWPFGPMMYLSDFLFDSIYCQGGRGHWYTAVVADC